MCLDPRPDRLFRATRSRRLSSAASLPRGREAASSTPAAVRGAALHAIEALAGEDELVARGWVVLSREAQA